MEHTGCQLGLAWRRAATPEVSCGPGGEDLRGYPQVPLNFRRSRPCKRFDPDESVPRRVVEREVHIYVDQISGRTARAVGHTFEGAAKAPPQQLLERAEVVVRVGVCAPYPRGDSAQIEVAETNSFVKHFEYGLNKGVFAPARELFRARHAFLPSIVITTGYYQW